MDPWEPTVLAIRTFTEGETLGFHLGILGRPVSLCLLAIRFVVGLVVSLPILALAYTILFNGLIHAVLIALIFLATCPMQIFRPIVAADAIGVIHFRPTCRS